MEWTIAFFDQLKKLLLATHADIGMIAFDHDKNYCDICDKCFFLLATTFCEMDEIVCV